MTTTELIRSEVQALHKRREELARLDAALAERESQASKLRGEMSAFESRYLRVVGGRYNKLAEIEKEIAKIQGLDFDEDDENYSGDSLADDEADGIISCGQNRFHSDKLKKLYREVARKLHPDLASCPTDRQHRHQLMVEVNRAYESGAEDRLQELLEAGENLEAVEADGAMSTEMILLLRRIAEAKQRIAEIESGIEEATSAELYKLKLRVETSEAMGIDLFADLLSQVDRQIKKARNRLFHLQLIHQGEAV
ncbi:MAG: J domain-containing protein [Acidobacteriota bacterium]|nr:J domain-containing protein [Acidobacteriota bacterium]